jgi:drug/metabolite transporter (DMT)-like permease
VHVAAALLGFVGAAVVILGGSGSLEAAPDASGWAGGYFAAVGSALIWSTYSLLTRRVAAFPTAAIGGFALVSGVLSLLCHAWLEPAIALTVQDGVLIAVMGLGPMGAAFFLWDRALKTGDARLIGILSYLTPLLSTALLITVGGRAMTWNVAVAAVMIVGAAILGTRSR